MNSPLTNVSPVDGRYANSGKVLSPYFSEYALIKYRIHVEIEYFIALEKVIPDHVKISETQKNQLRSIVSQFSIEEAEEIKSIEKVTNHDVKAVEYFIKKKMDSFGMSEVKEFIHFGLTSQDINNTSIPLLLKDAMQQVIIPSLENILLELGKMAGQYAKMPMLARTHGQPASPTTLGKEIKVFEERLQIQLETLKKLSYPAKFGGATGNFNAHMVAFKNVDWIKFGNHFVNDILGLSRSQTTTQIEHYDGLVSIFDNMSRINTILIDFSRDIWTYVSLDYFKQKIAKDEVGSSAMPHKVNPIDFENAEGNLGYANAIFRFLSEKLPISRLQRDLTDSTVLRNVGMPAAHSLIAYNSLLKGMGKLSVNEAKIRQDLEDNWLVVSEAIQTVLRREGYDQPYEALKALTRKNTKITEKEIFEFIDGLSVSDEIKGELKAINPFNYIGNA